MISRWFWVWECIVHLIDEWEIPFRTSGANFPASILGFYRPELIDFKKKFE